MYKALPATPGVRVSRVIIVFEHLLRKVDGKVRIRKVAPEGDTPTPSPSQPAQGRSWQTPRAPKEGSQMSSFTAEASTLHLTSNVSSLPAQHQHNPVPHPCSLSPCHDLRAFSAILVKYVSSSKRSRVASIIFTSPNEHEVTSEPGVAAAQSDGHVL